jgi:RHS repeat-associated protein
VRRSEATYDAEQNLASVTLPGATSASVTYTSDGDGLRQSRTAGSTTTHLLWDVSGSLPLLLDDGVDSYLYGPSSAPIAQVNDSTGVIQYLHGDLVGSTRLITSSSGTAVGTTEYDPYGNRTAHTGTADSTIGYSGNWTDPDTGLIYMRARDYDPATDQFLTVDPLVDETHSPYAYTTDDPLGDTDPTGLQCSNTVHLSPHVLIGRDDPRYTQMKKAFDSYSRGLTGPMSSAMETDIWFQICVGHAVGAVKCGLFGSELLGTGGVPSAMGAAIFLLGNTNANEGDFSLQPSTLRFAQKTYSENFSKSGAFSGQTISSVSSQLRSGALSPEDVTVGVVVLNGNPLVVNTRSAIALQRAGIPMSEWNLIDQSGDTGAIQRVAAQLQNNGLSSDGFQNPRSTARPEDGTDEGDGGAPGDGVGEGGGGDG